jgi:hypothetical protein
MLFSEAVDKALAAKLDAFRNEKHRAGLARLWWRAFSSLPGLFARRRWGSGSRAMNAA